MIALSKQNLVLMRTNRLVTINLRRRFCFESAISGQSSATASRRNDGSIETPGLMVAATVILRT